MKNRDTAFQLQEVGKKVEKLLDLCAKLDERNRLTKAKTEELQRVHNALLQQQQETRRCVEALLEKLRLLEKNL